jgi:hydrogenase expression/formation protein HypC
VCLAVPAEVISIDGAFARVDFGGVRRRIAIALTPGVQPGQFVIVHAGMAIEVVDLDEVQRTLALIREVYGDDAPDQAGGRDAADV